MGYSGYESNILRPRSHNRHNRHSDIHRDVKTPIFSGDSEGTSRTKNQWPYSEGTLDQGLIFSPYDADHSSSDVLLS